MRKGRVKIKDLQPDPRYGDPMVTRFVNSLMYSGKKSVAYKIFYDACDIADERQDGDETGYEIWKQALDNVMPSVEVKSRRVGGSTFQIPIPVSSRRKVTLGVSWLIGFARKRNGKTMADKLANEMIAASKGEGAAVKKRDEVHRMADANKAFAHYNR